MHVQCWKSTRRWNKIIVLWILFTIQLMLIGSFVLFGTSSRNISNDITDDSSQTYRSLAFHRKIVKFLKNSQDISLMNKKSSSSSNSRLSTTPSSLTNVIGLPQSKTFHDAFFECQNGKAANFTPDTLFCFRNGSVLPISVYLRGHLSSSDEGDECLCKCQADYHGRDCGQPEVVWRAFMTAHISRTEDNEIENRKISDESEPKPHRIFYLIDSSARSLSTVEIQFMELRDLVDLFILCDEIRNGSAVHEVSTKHERFLYHQQSDEHRSNFFLKQLKSNILILETRYKCTPKWMYKMFRNKMETPQSDDNNALNGNDVLLFSAYDEILNRQAIQYIKWYRNWSQSQPIRFRLKYTVYGFYWQHPEHTVLSSGACQLHVLDELYMGDPVAMKRATNTGMIIGDLNHYGGWFCQYCYESSVQILQKLQRDRMINDVLSSDDVDTKDEDRKKIQQKQQQQSQQQRATLIDAAYIESLISAGVFVDGKLDLIRLHRFSDKYYAPDYVTEKSWKYESLLTNTYAHYDGEDDE